MAPSKDGAHTYHGRTFADPYHWLREKGSPDVERYLDEENAYTAATSAGIQPLVDALYREMLGRIKQTDLSVPTRIRGFHYYWRTVEGLQYPIRYRRPAALDGSYTEDTREQVLLDPNEMATGLAFLSIGELEVSDDDQQLLYSTDTTGFRQYSLFVKDLRTDATSAPLADRVTSAVWAADSRSFFYVTEHPITKRSDALWRLRLGGDTEKVYEEQDALFSLVVSRTKDLKYVVLVSRSTDTWDCWMVPSRTPAAALRQVLPRQKGHKYNVEHRDGTLFIRTNKAAKNFRLVSAPADDPAPARWQSVLEHREDVLLQQLEVFKDFLVVQEKCAGVNHLRVHDFDGGTWTTIPFSEPVYAAVAAGTPEYDSSRFRYTYQSMITPASVYDYDTRSGAPVLLKREDVLGGYDPERYASERLWATARDGTRVPISIVYPRDFVRNGRAPLWLYAYGAYGLGMPATFDSRRLSLLDRGIPYAIAHVRGGNEMGESWHDAGMLMEKRNTFFDFIDCAHHLIAQQWTSPEGLLIEGGSAGGLLMGVVVNERPDLFRAVHAAVPFVDVINSMMDASLPLTIGEYLEWGNPNEESAFDYILSYSPYDNLARKAYPAMLITTSYNDSQVMYWEPAKYVARLRALKTDRNLLVLKTRMQAAGHGGASGRYDALQERAFQVAWMLTQVGITR